MSVATVKAALAVLQVQIAGVQKAYAQAPNSVTAGDMPLFVNLTGAATYDREEGEDYDKETREYRMFLYVCPQMTGIPGEGEALCEPFFPLVRDFFSSRPSLGGVTDVLTSRPTGDGGVQILRFGDTPYIGIEFKLDVVEVLPITYAAGE